MISHKHKCIFIHIPKTAGTSINSFFYPKVKFHFNNPDYERLFGWCPKRKLHMQHATAKQLLETELVTEEQWSNYFKFVFVRNPWDRAYSDYNFVQKFSGVQGSFKDFLNKASAFHDILNNSSNSNYLGDHLLPQTNFFETHGVYKPDYIGRFENFSMDIKKVLSSLDISKEFNVFQNKSERKKDYSLFYTNSEKALVSQLYKEDILQFGYSFEDNRKGLYVLKKLM
ncbi:MULTISPECIES: sulfotransferase family 2 domain-containing protein [Flavobacteriaceae]|uniref:Sulfotransferase family protein n=1 Tax=Meridianimaribacter flavus TaxID=571115 RepID=A0ABY2G4N4_9FLAO|nr:sulfotransferase family 2 domain-containing protein [Meridianimaribacter flavus]TDY11770.1 sulfotransferase family protein [Meridianimaribacter flavus]